MDLHVLFVLLLSIGAAVQSKPKLCNGVTQKNGASQNKDEERQEGEVSARTFNRLSLLRPGLIFRGSSSTADLPQPNNKRPGNIGLLHGSGGVPNGGYGMIHGGGEKQTLTRNRIFGQGVGLRNNSLSQKIGNLINYQTFGILSGNSLNVNRTQQNNSGPSYQVYLPNGLHQTNSIGEQSVGSVGGQSVGGGGGHGGMGGALLNHGLHRPHHHFSGGPANNQGGHLSGLLGHHHGLSQHHHHGLHPGHPHTHHGIHGPVALGNAGILGSRPGHHQLHGGLLGATLLLGGGSGPHHEKPVGLGGLGLIHGGIHGGGQTSANIVGQRPHTQGTLGLIHNAFSNQGLAGNSEGNNAVQSQQHQGGLLGLLHNGLGAQNVLIGGVAGNNHLVGGSGLGSSHLFGQHGLLHFINGGHVETQGGGFQTVTASELKPGHVYLHLGAIGTQHGGQTDGTGASSLQPVASIGSGQVYGQGGVPVFTQSVQGVQGQIFETGSNYQTGVTGTSQSGQFQSQHNLHQGTLSQGGAAAVTSSNTGGYGVIPAQQSYQGSIYETQWAPHPAVGSIAESTHTAGSLGLSSGNINSYNQVNQGSSNVMSEANVQSVYGNQNTYGGNNNQYGTSQSTNGNYNSGHTAATTGNVGVYGFNQGTYPVGVYNQTLGQGNIYGGTSTQHSQQSSSTSSYGSNSSSQAQETSSQQSYYSGGNLLGVNGGGGTGSVVHVQPSAHYVGDNQNSLQNHVNTNAQVQGNYIAGTNYFQNSGGASDQHVGSYGSTAFSGSYPHQQGYHNTNDQKDGDYAHGSVIYVIQQTPLADEESYIGVSEASGSGSIAGSGTGTIGGAMSSMSDNKLAISGSGDSTSSVSASQNYMGPSSAVSASDVKYGGTSSSSSLQSGNHGSSSAQYQSTSGNILQAGSASHSSVGSLDSSGTSGSSGSLGSSYNTQHRQPTFGSAATQSTGSSSQHHVSSLHASPQYGSINSASMSGNVGSSSLASQSSSTNGNSFSNVNRENAASEGGTTVSNSNNWQALGSGVSAGTASSSSGEVLSTQTNGPGQSASSGPVSSSSQIASTANHELSFNSSGSSSRPTSSSHATNQVLISGIGQQTSKLPSSSGTSGTSVNSAFNTGDTHGTISSTQTNTSGQYGLSRPIDTTSSSITSNYNALHNGISSGQMESSETTFSTIKRPSNEGGQESSALTSSVGSSQQHHTSRPSPSTGVQVEKESGYISGNGAYSSHYGNNQMLTANNVMGLSSSHLTAPEHSSAHVSAVHGGNGQILTNGGGQGYIVSSTSSTKYNNQYGANDKTGTNVMTNQQGGSNVQVSSSSAGQYIDMGSLFQAGNSNSEPSSSNFGTMYQSSSANNQPTGTEGVSITVSPSSNMVSSFGETGNVHPVGISGLQMYGVSTNKEGHVFESEGSGHQTSAFAVHSNTNDQLNVIGSADSQGSGLIGNTAFNSQHTLNSSPSGSSSAILSQSSSANSENPETDVAFSNEDVESGTTGQISNQFSNSNNMFGMLSSTSGGSGGYELVNENMDTHMTSFSGSSGGSVLEANKYPTSTSNSQLSSSTHGNNQFTSSMTNVGGTGNHSPSTLSYSQLHGSGEYTSGGNTEVAYLDTNGRGSIINAQGQSSVGPTAATGSGINKKLTGSVQATSFRYPGQYTFKYGYVHPNSMYPNIDYPPSNSYDPSKIVYSGDVNPNTGSSGFYYHYSTAGNPIRISSVHGYDPVQPNDQDHLNQLKFSESSNQNGHLPLLIDVDEEDVPFEETQTGIKGNLQGHFEHSGGGSFEGSVSRPFQGGISFSGNHELSTGVSGGVSGHLGNVGNFQGFLGNAANKVGGIISGVGQAVGIIRDQGDDSQAKGGLGFDSQGNSNGALQKTQGNLKTNNQHSILTLYPRTQLELQKEPSLHIYLPESYKSEFSNTFSDKENKRRTLILPSSMADAFRDPKGIALEEDNLNSEAVK